MSDDHLSALDAGFLQTEDGDSHISMAVAALALLEGPAPDFAEVKSVLDERCASLPRSRSVLRTYPLDFEPPHWVPDHAFNIDHHVRRVAVSSPGDDSALHRTIADLMERRLDRSRPLWEAWVIDGLTDDRWAILIKVHHCVADGVAATAMLSEICDGSRLKSIAPPLGEISESRNTAHRLPNPFDVARNAVRTGISTMRGVLRVVAGAGEIVGGLITPVPQPLTKPLTDLRRFSATRVSMNDVQLICQRFNVTVNDVALAAITDGFRSAMLHHGLVPKAGSMRTLVPVSVRSADALHVPDNRVSVMLPNLPVDKSDPVDQLRLVHQRLEFTKHSGQRQAGSLAVAGGNLVPYPIIATAIRLLSRVPQRGVVTLATNIHGPEHRLRFMEREIVELVPVPPIALGLQAGIAIMSYAGQLALGVIGDFDAQIDADELASGIAEGFERLLAVASAAKSSRQMGNLLLLSS